MKRSQVDSDTNLNGKGRGTDGKSLAVVMTLSGGLVLVETHPGPPDT